MGSRVPAGGTLDAPRATEPVTAFAYILIAFGVMQAIAYSHRHVADWREGIRFIAAIALVSALIFGALIALGDQSDLAIKVGLIISYSALLFTLADLTLLNPGRRVAPISSIALIAAGSILLKLVVIID
ncbi:MAG: hypothetical protein AAGH74_01390 [Pseudomonadota bacterium]